MIELHLPVERLLREIDVRARIAGLPWTMIRPAWQDVVLALAVGAAGQVDVLAPDLVSTNVVGPTWAVSVTYLVASLALVLRRSRPVETFAVVLVALGFQAATIGASEGNGTLLPALVATYSLAAHAPRRAALVGLATVPLLIAVREFNNPQNTSADEVVNALGWDLTIIAAWLLGAYLRTRRLLVRELQERAAAAEREREVQAQSAVAEERARIARELHDVVAHSVAVIVVQAEAAEEMLTRQPARAAAPLQAIQRTGRETLTEMRRLLGALHDEEGPGPLTGIAALPDLVAGVRETGLEVDLDLAVSASAPSTADRAVYRIVQESLTNVLKHADARRAWVRVGNADGGLSVEVSDDGVGGAAAPNGHGLAGMRERVSVHGGRFEAGPGPGRGFVVRAWLPVRVER